MPKKSVVARVKKRIKLADKYANKIAKLKKTIATGSDAEAWEARLALQKVPRDAHRVRQHNLCAITGRARGVYKRYGVCRHVLRKWASEGFIPGLTKSSW